MNMYGMCGQQHNATQCNICLWIEWLIKKRIHILIENNILINIIFIFLLSFSLRFYVSVEFEFYYLLNYSNKWATGHRVHNLYDLSSIILIKFNVLKCNHTELQLCSVFISKDLNSYMPNPRFKSTLPSGNSSRIVW